MNLLSFEEEEKDSRFTRLKPDLALRLLSKELFYIRAMSIGRRESRFVETDLLVREQKHRT